MNYILKDYIKINEDHMKRLMFIFGIVVLTLVSCQDKVATTVETTTTDTTVVLVDTVAVDTAAVDTTK